MFRFFEKLLHPYPAAEPALPPTGFFAFLWACTQGLRLKMAAMAVLTGLLFGLAPALHSTRLELVRAMRGEVTRDARPGRVRQVLIGSQVTASALLLVCAAVFGVGLEDLAHPDRIRARLNDRVLRPLQLRRRHAPAGRRRDHRQQQGRRRHGPLHVSASCTPRG